MMILEYYDNLIKSIEGKLEDTPESWSPRKVYALEVARLGRRLYSGEGTVAWCGVAAPFDLLSALGVSSCYAEFVGATLASMEMAGPPLERAEQAGYGTDTCAYHRSGIGAALMGMVPVPDFLIGTSTPCTGGLATIENLARIFDRDMFVLHVPQSATEESVEYLAGQLRDMVAFVEHHTGRRAHHDDIREAMDRANETRDLMAEVFALGGHLPSPMHTRSLGNLGIVMPLFLGSLAGLDIAHAFKDDFTRRIINEEWGLADERIRLLWIQNRIQFKQPLYQVMEQFGANIVADEFNHVYWDPVDIDDPYSGLARRAIGMPLNIGMEERLGRLEWKAREYKVDGAIHPCHWGCRQGTGSRGIFIDHFKRLGIPLLTLDVDCVDHRNFSLGQLSTRVEAFLEMLGSGEE